MVGSYKKTKKQLTQAQINSIEQDLIKSNKSQKELAQKYGVFDDVISEIAKDMGLIGADKEEEVYPRTTVIASAPKAVAHKRKERTEITDAIRKMVIENVKAGVAKKEILTKYNISDSSFRRIIINLTKEDITPVEDVYSVSFVKIDPKELIDITNEIGSEMYVRLYKSFPVPEDSTAKAYLFDDKEDNYTEALKNFKERYLKNTKIEALTVFVLNESIDMKVSVALTKWCIENQTNLVLKPLNKEPINLITEFAQCSRNFSTFNKRTIGCKKYIYKSTKEKVEKVSTIYCVTSFKDVIVTDTIDKALEYIARFEKVCHENLMNHKLELFQVNCGNYRQLFKLLKE